jgi:hypothetical protein
MVVKSKDMDRSGYDLFQLPEQTEENHKKFSQNKQRPGWVCW